MTVDDVVRGVRIALNEIDLSFCLELDVDGDNEITIDELVRAVGELLDGGCASVATPTATPVIPGGTTLSLIQTFQDGVDDTRGLLLSRSIAVSPDGRHVYVGTEAPDGGIVSFRRDQETGRLSFLSFFQGDADNVPPIGGVRDIALTPNGAHLYATAIAQLLIGFAIDSETGVLDPVELVAGPNAPVGGAVSIRATGEDIYLAGYPFGAAVFRENSTGTVEYVQQRQLGFGITASDLVISSDGISLYVIGTVYPPAPLSSYQVSMFRRDEETGAIEPVEQLLNGDRPNLIGSVTASMSGDQKYLYVLRRTVDEPIVVFERDPVQGVLTSIPKPISVFDLGTPTSICPMPGRPLVFITGVNQALARGRIGTFRHDVASSLQLTDLYRDEEFGGIHAPSDCALGPDGRHLYVTDSSGVLSAFAVNVQ